MEEVTTTEQDIDYVLSTIDELTKSYFEGTLSAARIMHVRSVVKEALKTLPVMKGTEENDQTHLRPLPQQAPNRMDV